MDISLRQLEAFIKVAEHRSFSKAGDELFLSQSTISSHVAQLEQSLQVTLIKRREKKNIELTEEGQRAYRAAQIIINQAEMLQNMFRKEEADQPLIPIAASTVPSSYILPDIMTGFSDIRPECRFSVLDGDSSFALERLQNGEAVFAFVGTSSRKTIFSYHTVCRDRMVLITQNNKEFAETKEIKLVQIKDHETKNGIYHINTINNYHSRLKKFLDPFNGVATKYLDNYLVWFNYLNNTKGDDEYKLNALLNYIIRHPISITKREIPMRPAIPILTV